MNPSNPSNSTNPMVNALTIDLEDYYQVHAFSKVVRFEDWGNYESRIEPNTHRLLEILGESGIGHRAQGIGSELSPYDSRLTPHGSARATFFCLGWLAERYPHLIRTIKGEGHEIASHGYAHKLIYTQTKGEFREDIRKAKAILEDITGDEVIGYRAPSYSITNKSQWAFEVLMEEGFKYDSSIFPIHHDFYGFPQAPRFPFLISINGDNTFEFRSLNFGFKETQSSVLSPQSSVNSMNPSNSSNSSNPSNPTTRHSTLDTCHSLLEFPISTVHILGVNIPVSGGGYFRLFPYSIIKKGLTRINRIEGMPFIFYLHPWELDDEQPRINSISKLSRFRHYMNLHKTEERFKKLLSDFRFSSISDVLNGSTATLQYGSTY